MRYLNPKTDLTFKLVFGEHPDLVMSFLNALLPLKPEEYITEIEYLPSEMVPENPLRKNSIVDVRCKDKRGHCFVVETETIWSEEFEYRVSLDASGAYVRPIRPGKEYNLLQPVYSLCLSESVFEPELEGYYHHYDNVYVEETRELVNGLHLVFIELPKFTPSACAEEKMRTLWLRYLTEIKENAREVPQDLLTVPEIKKAVAALEESTFTEGQLLLQEKFWDIISVERTLISSARRRGIEKGRKEAEKKKEKFFIAANLKKQNIPFEVIAQSTGLSIEEIEKL